jgi:hypothetical protein
MREKREKGVIGKADTYNLICNFGGVVGVGRDTECWFVVMENILNSKSIKLVNNQVLICIKNMNIVIQQGMQKGSRVGLVFMDDGTKFTVTGKEGLEQVNVMG